MDGVIFYDGNVMPLFNVYATHASHLGKNYSKNGIK